MSKQLKEIILYLAKHGHYGKYLYGFLFSNFIDHPIKNESMKWEHRVPV